MAALQFNIDTLNTQLEQLIGAPIDRYDDPADVPLQMIYNFFKPSIFTIFDDINRAAQVQHRMRDHFHRVSHIGIPDHEEPGPGSFFYRAYVCGLFPRFPQLQSDFDFRRWNASTDRLPFSLNQYFPVWYQYLFLQAGRDPRIIVQGGEAVNQYSFLKYDNVPTHDADVRICLGDHYHYLAPLNQIDNAIHRHLQRLRFFVSFALCLEMQAFWTAIVQDVAQGNVAATTYFQFFFGGNAPTDFACTVQLGNDDLYQIIESDVYDINAIRNVAYLVGITVTVMGVDAPVVDLFAPYKRPFHSHQDVHRLGQSDALHSYFATDQARSVHPDGLNIVDPGRVPFLDQVLHVPNQIPGYGGQDWPLRMVPLGYLLWDTLRMLHVCKEQLRLIQRSQQQHPGQPLPAGLPQAHSVKLLKYKQKLNVLLSTLILDDINQGIFTICQGSKLRPTAAHPPNPGDYLLGGGKPSSQNSTVSEEIDEIPVDLETMLPMELVELFDRYSYQYPEFRDFRLPVSTKDQKTRFRPIPLLPPSVKGWNAFQKGNKTKGGYRKTKRAKRSSAASRKHRKN